MFTEIIVELVQRSVRKDDERKRLIGELFLALLSGVGEQKSSIRSFERHSKRFNVKNFDHEEQICR